MATKVKEGPPTKEKRGTSLPHPPQNDTTQRRKSPSTSKQASPAKRSNSTSPSGRQVPNYLKPTISSGLESSTHHVKKHSLAETIKPTISRRKSLEKPLPPSYVAKTRASTVTRETKNQSSLPSVVKASGLTKPKASNTAAADSRNLIKRKENEASGLLTKETKTETLNIDHGHGTAPKEDHVLETPQIESTEEKEEDLHSSITQIDEDHKNKDMEEEVMVLEDNNMHINIETEVEVEEVKMDESLIVFKEENESHDSTTKQPEEKVEENEVTSKEHGELQPNTHLEQPSPNQVLAEASEEKEAKGQKEDFSTNQELKEKEEAAEASEDVGRREREIVKDNSKEEKNGVENAAVKQQVVPGKRESVVSNDVIEETATKLREQRKNKVKALAGAFETVISSQESK